MCDGLITVQVSVKVTGTVIVHGNKYESVHRNPSSLGVNTSQDLGTHLFKATKKKWYGWLHSYIVPLIIRLGQWIPCHYLRSHL